jgi:chromosome segregation protein
MKIKKLYLRGFKSFVDETTIVLGPEINGIVGPNGCGKSNVVDAIKWCMGEQSAKLLRGSEMADVIFNGSETRKAVGMAEVSMTFDNTGAARPMAFDQYSEIEITRRLYRNGDSEYLINKSPARLRDVQELFMDTGVGARAYSIIEQGQIGALINAKPEDRRFLIEEAAGITKYKKRKEEAMRKLEQTEQNLLRIGDLSKELKSQLNRLDRQARKAERYKELQTEIRRIELGLLHARHTDLAAQLQAATEKLAALTERNTSLAAGMSDFEAGAETLKLTIVQLEKEVGEWRDKAFAAAAKVTNHEKDLEVNRSKLESTTLQIASLEREMLDADKRRMELRAEIDATSGALETLENNLADRDETFRAEEAKLGGYQKSVEELAKQYDAAGNAVMQFMQRMTELKGVIEASRSRRDDLIHRMEETQLEVDERRHNLEEAAGKAAEHRKALDEADAERLRLMARREKLQGEMEAQRKELEEGQPKLDEARRLLQEKQSRLQSLRELEAAHEGVREGVRQLLEKHKNDPGTGLHGILADALEPAAGLEAAIAAYLGERLEALVVAGRDQALGAVRYLREGEGRGRALFLPADLTVPERTPKSGALLADQVRFKGTYGAVARELLRNVLVADGDEAAVALAQENPGFAVVSKLGLVIHTDGALAGGGEDRGTALLRQKREMVELEDDIRTRQAALRSLEEDMLELKKRQQWLAEEVEQVRVDAHKAEIQCTELQRDLSTAENERNRLGRELESLDEDVTSFQGDMDEVLGWLGDAEKNLIEANRQHQQALADRDAITQRHAEARQAVDEHQGRISDLRVELTEARSALNSRREMHARLVRELQNMDERGGRADLEVVEARKRQAEFQRLIDEAAGGTGALLAAQRELEQGTRDAVDRYEAVRNELTNKEGSVKDQRRELEGVRTELNAENLRLAELQKDAEHVRGQFGEKYGTGVEQLGEADMDVDGTPEERTERLNVLRRKAEDMGEINLSAINEYKEIEQRYTFIAGQQSDLVESVDALKKAIAKINKTSRERFMHTFAVVNEKFKMVFPRLFNGGHAELRLTEEEDYLEAGIEIIAQPPGKKLQRVNLLSGGEKALTATSLIFAIFLLKPSPFCLLDEVDAPLDDANIDRFNALLEEMNRYSQIILITHNKHTMEIVDNLWGVTMQESGVSSVLSAELKNYAIA